jgi:hypothetical protein
MGIIQNRLIKSIWARAGHRLWETYYNKPLDASTLNTPKEEEDYYITGVLALSLAYACHPYGNINDHGWGDIVLSRLKRLEIHPCPARQAKQLVHKWLDNELLEFMPIWHSIWGVPTAELLSHGGFFDCESSSQTDLDNESSAQADLSPPEKPLIIKCPGCGGVVSLRATSCTHCGKAVEKNAQ